MLKNGHCHPHPGHAQMYLNCRHLKCVCLEKKPVISAQQSRSLKNYIVLALIKLNVRDQLLFLHQHLIKNETMI